MPFRPTRHRSGFALIDVIIGGVLLGIGLAVVITITTRSLHTQTNGEHRLVAAWLADELLNMVLVEGPIEYPQLYDTHGRFDPPFEAFQYDLDIEDNGLGEPFSVTAGIRWESGRGYSRIQVETLIAPRLGDPIQPRAPIEPIDRESRYYDDEDL